MTSCLPAVNATTKIIWHRWVTTMCDFATEAYKKERGSRPALNVFTTELCRLKIVIEIKSVRKREAHTYRKGYTCRLLMLRLVIEVVFIFDL